MTFRAAWLSGHNYLLGSARMQPLRQISPCRLVEPKPPSSCAAIAYTLILAVLSAPQQSSHCKPR